MRIRRSKPVMLAPMRRTPLSGPSSTTSRRHWHCSEWSELYLTTTYTSGLRFFGDTRSSSLPIQMTQTGHLPPPQPAEDSFPRDAGVETPVELASERKIRTRNKIHYRFSHWPIWIWVFFIAPGPLTSDLFDTGFDRRMAAWLGAVLLATGIAGLRGRLPGVEPRPYIIRFTEDKPNPLYRRVCYTFTWSAVVTFALLNITGLIVSALTGGWYLRQMYDVAYFPIAMVIWTLGALGQLPRVRRSTKGEGHERRYFYGSVWAVCLAQPVLWFLWAVLPQTPAADVSKLVVFIGILGWVGWLSYRGKMPRTRQIVPGESAVSD